MLGGNERLGKQSFLSEAAVIRRQSLPSAVFSREHWIIFTRFVTRRSADPMTVCSILPYRGRQRRCEVSTVKLNYNPGLQITPLRSVPDAVIFVTES